MYKVELTEGNQTVLIGFSLNRDTALGILKEAREFHYGHNGVNLRLRKYNPSLKMYVTEKE